MADLTTSFASDWQVWDNTEAVGLEYARRSAVDSLANQPDAVPVAKRRKLTTRELAASGGAYTGGDRVFLVPAALLPPDRALKPADVVITDQGANRWTALEAELGKGGQTWRLTCRNLAIAADLADTVWLEKAAISFDAAGAPVKTWPPAGGTSIQLNARVQLVSSEVMDSRAVRGGKGVCQITIDRQTPVNTEDRVRWVDAQGLIAAVGATVYFDIRGVHNPMRIDELPVIDAEARP